MSCVGAGRQGRGSSATRGLLRSHRLGHAHGARAAHGIHAVDLRHHARRLRRRRERQHEGDAQAVGHTFHHLAQQLARRRVEPDEGALEYQHLGRREQRTRYVVAAQLAARERHQLAVEQRPQPQQAEQLVAPRLARGLGPREQRPDGGRRGAVGGVPPLLVVVGRLGRAVGVR